MPKVYQTEEFEKEVERLSKSQKVQIESIKDQLTQSIDVGQILRYPFLREKRIGEKRLYFLIYKEWDAVLLVAISDKKAQNATIDKIVEFLLEYKKLMGTLVNGPS